METTTTSTSSSVRTWCILAHATALVGFLVPVAGHIVGPLIVWLAKRQDSPEIDAHGKESMNFQISMLIWNVIAGILCLVLIGIPNLLDEFEAYRLLIYGAVLVGIMILRPQGLIPNIRRSRELLDEEREQDQWGGSASDGVRSGIAAGTVQESE